MQKFYFSVFLVVLMFFSSYSAISGVVVDQNNTPVPDAMITYTNIANRVVYVYSNNSGKFCIPAPTEWNLNDLSMYKTTLCETQIRKNFNNNTKNSNFNIAINGKSLFFTINQTSEKPVSASLYDSKGKFIAVLFNKSLDKGNYLITLPKNLSNQVYLLKISNGSINEIVQIAVYGNSSAFSLADKTELLNYPNGIRLAKINAIDSIRVGKTGYAATKIAINSYSENAGNVKITKVDIERRVDSLLSLMTTDEKVGQLLQPSGASESSAKTYLLGSYLKGEGSAGPMNGALSTRLKIPLLVGNDFVHGGRKVYFPHNIGMGCTRDTLLVELAYRIYAMCCIPLYNNVNFAPCIDVHRTDLSGRVYEGFSETPEVASMMARAAVRGTQGTDLTSPYTMAATLKHWAAAGGTAQGQGHGDVNTAPNMGIISQIHFPPFRAGVNAGAASVMTGYQSVFGTPMAVNTQLVTDTLKNKWGFDGFVVTDWGTSSGREVSCMNAGHDLFMTIDVNSFPNIIKNALSNNQISQNRLDDAVRRLLRIKFRLGLFENPWPDLRLNNYLDSDIYRAVARACVRKSLVLLKNENSTLPISKTANVHVVGEWADNLGYQCGGWSATSGTGDEGWQGSSVAHGIPGATTILQGIQSICKGTVTYATNASNIPASANVIVVAVGETPYAEDAGDRTDITISTDHQNLVASCAASGKPVVTILITGRPMALNTIPNNSKALVAAWLPGTEGGGIADVLFGDYNFTGKLSHTWPASNSQEPINTGNMGDATGSGGNPLYPFGYGLSY